MSRKFGKIIIFVAIIVVSVTLYFTMHSRKVDNNNIQTNTIAPVTQNQLEVPRAPSPENKTNYSQADPAQSNMVTAAQDKPVPQDASSKPTAPAKYLLDMPFYSQAPLGKWDAVHENTCEEASVLNAGLYLLGKKISSAGFDNEMMNIIGIEKKLSINFTDSTIAETKQFSEAYFTGKLQAKIINDPTAGQIESEIATGNPVIVPLAGRDIGNPNFTPPGPIYHMLVIKGYDSQNFITNDVGTRKGNSYVYKKDVIMRNIHDWNEKDIHLGTKRVLVLMKN